LRLLIQERGRAEHLYVSAAQQLLDRIIDISGSQTTTLVPQPVHVAPTVNGRKKRRGTQGQAHCAVRRGQALGCFREDAIGFHRWSAEVMTEAARLRGNPHGARDVF
jgi:hypothetical protein